jgi:hypothetical protein
MQSSGCGQPEEVLELALLRFYFEARWTTAI